MQLQLSHTQTVKQANIVPSKSSLNYWLTNCQNLFPAWVGSVSVGVMYLFGPITSGLSERFGCRVVAFLGGFLCSMGMLLTSFVTDLPKLYVTYGVLWGIGSSFCYFPTLTAPGEYFCHRLSLVNGFVTAGKWDTIFSVFRNDSVSYDLL